MYPLINNNVLPDSVDSISTAKLSSINFNNVNILKIIKSLNVLFKFLDDNNLLSSNQSGFRPSDSCEYQLLSIVHDIYASFDCCPSLEVRGVFLDISKAFDRVWHEGLIYKLQSLGISGLPLKCIESFLLNRFQMVSHLHGCQCLLTCLKDLS